MQTSHRLQNFLSNSLEDAKKINAHITLSQERKSPVMIDVGNLTDFTINDPLSVNLTTKAHRDMNMTSNLMSHRVSTDGRKLVDFGAGIPKIPMPNLGSDYKKKN